LTHSTEKRVTIKLKLEKIFKNDVNYNKLNDIITNANKLINIGYLFMRSFMLYTIENRSKISKPKFDVDFIRLTFSVISNDNQSKKGRPFNKDKEPYLNILQTYFKIFRMYTKINTIPATNFSYILGQSYEQIYISVINNIKYHFDKHI